MEQIINEIEQSMVNLLDNMEMEELHNVLVNTLCGLTIIENKNNKNSCEKDYCDMFICAKRVEGCSEKTIKYYYFYKNYKILIFYTQIYLNNLLFFYNIYFLIYNFYYN